MDLEGLSREELIDRLRVLIEVARPAPALPDPCDERDRILRELGLAVAPQSRAPGEAQGALEEGRGRYADLYDFAPVAYLMLSRGGVVLDVNRTGVEMLGRPRGELLGKPLLSETRAERRNELSRHLRRCVRSPGPVASELILSTTQRPLEVQAISTARRERGGPPVCRTVFVDITGLKERERALSRARQKRLTVLAQAGRQLAEPMELEGTLQAISRLVVPELADLCRVSVLRDGGGYRTVLATHRDPVVQKRLDRLVDRSLLDAGPEIVRAALERGRPQLRRVSPRYPVDWLAWDQPERDILEQLGVRQAIAAPLLLVERPIGLLTLMMAESGRTFGEEDLALVEELAAEAVLALERSRVYRSAQEAIRAREGILALVSHDLMNPLSAIKLGAHALLEHGLSGRDPAGQRQIAVIQGAASRMNRLIGELRDAATIEGGQLRVELEPERGRALIEEVALMVAPQVEAAHRLDLVLGPDSPEILCDRQRIFQVVANLVDNAVKFTPRGGRIRIATETLGDMFQVSVSDTGPGLRECEVERVFDRYWRSHPATQAGSGLGLYIARGIVQAHGGRIWAENEAGGGTRFTVALPLSPSGDLTAPSAPRA